LHWFFNKPLNITISFWTSGVSSRTKRSVMYSTYSLFSTIHMQSWFTSCKLANVPRIASFIYFYSRGRFSTWSRSLNSYSPCVITKKASINLILALFWPSPMNVLTFSISDTLQKHSKPTRNSLIDLLSTTDLNINSHKSLELLIWFL